MKQNSQVLLSFLYSLLIIFGFVSVGFGSMSSNFDEFKPAQVSGTVPEIFKTSKEEWARKPFDNLSASGVDKNKIVKFQKLYRNSMYSLFWRGEILFGDEYSSYLNQIKDIILRANKLDGLKKEITCYSSKSKSITPLTLADGSIIIPISLIAQAENEAQLAFLLAHEISSYLQIKKKEYTNFLVNKSSTLSETENDVFVQNFNRKFLANETVNDKAGLQLLKKTKYNQEDAINMLIIMQYSFLPYGEKRMKGDFFNTKYAKIPDEFFSSEVVVSQSEYENLENKQSNSGFESRIEKLALLVKSSSGNEFVLSESRFNKIAMLTKFENQKIHIDNKNYIRTVNESYALLQLYPNNNYLKDCFIGGLYVLAKQKTGFKTKFAMPNETFSNGDMVFESFYRSSKKEVFKIFTVNYIKENGNESHQRFAEDLLFELVHYSDLNLDTLKLSQDNSEKISLYEKTKGWDSKILDNKLGEPDIGIKTENIEKVDFKEVDSLSYLQLSKVEKINYNRKLIKYRAYLKSIKEKKYKDSIMDVPLKEIFFDSATLQKELIKKEKESKLEEKIANNLKITHQFISSSIKNWNEDSTMKIILLELENLSPKLNYRIHFIGKLNEDVAKNEVDKHRFFRNSFDSIICFEPKYKVIDNRRDRHRMQYAEQEMKNEKLKESISIGLEKKGINYTKTFVSASDSVDADKVIEILNAKKLQTYGKFYTETDRFEIMSDYNSYSNLEEKYKYLLTTEVESERVSRSFVMLLAGLASFFAAPLAVAIYITPKYIVHKKMVLSDMQGNVIYEKIIKPKNRPNVFLDQLFVNDFINLIAAK